MTSVESRVKRLAGVEGVDTGTHEVRPEGGGLEDGGSEAGSADARSRYGVTSSRTLLRNVAGEELCGPGLP